MRALAALLIALVALAPVSAFAEAADPAQDRALATYASEGGGYSIGYPADWTLLSRETIQATLDALAGGALQVEGIDSPMLAAYAEQIAVSDAAMFLSPDGAISASVVYEAVPAPLSAGDIIDKAYPGILADLQALLPGYEEVAGAEAQPIGDREFVGAMGGYEAGGTRYAMVQAYCCIGNAFFTVTFTVDTSVYPDIEAIYAVSDAMLASLAAA